MRKYNPKEIEKKWQDFWEKNKTFEVKEDPSKQKFYPLIEFPFISGAGLHVGHTRPFTAMDAIARKRRMEEFNVLYPIGFDSFGLPTENFAIKTGRPPAEIVAENIANFTHQLSSLGFSFDWSRKVDTSDPKYYKWTQWIFLQLFKHGLAYKTNQPINWCPKDKIGLANEEVVNGCCERCGTPVEQRNKDQWMLAITKYADKLLEGLKTVDYITPARVQQENWIGRSEGAMIRFSVVIPTEMEESLSLEVKGSLGYARDDKTTIEVFTTRPDTIFGATFLAISAEVAKKWVDVGWEASADIKKYVEQTLDEQIAGSREEKPKTGIDTGVKAINPVNNEAIPVWITNYVLGDVGTGAIMAVPAHDERDYEFAKKYGLAIKQVVAPLIINTGTHAPHADKETHNRKVATAIIRHPKTGKYLLLKHTDAISFVGGGIEDGEDAYTTIVREIREETGYTNVHVEPRPLLDLYGYGYKQRKGINCCDPDTVFYAEILNDEQKDLDAHEQKDHAVIWLTKKEITEQLTKDHFVFIWNWYLNGGQCIDGDGFVISSDFLNDLSTPEAKEKIIAWLEEKKLGKRQVTYKLRDWVFSRQRYWGEPIPLVFCENCAGWVPLPESELPLKLPKVEKYQPTDTGESPLSAMTNWVNTKCPQCGGAAKRETDTMPNWAGSSWYFLRYCDPDNDKQFASPEKLKYWTPVDWYNGGMEHTVLHLLYSRFWNQFLFDIGVVPTSEPYKKRTSHGMILGPDGEKMSKSRGNVINPDEMVEKFGADAFRMYIMFMGPFDQAVMWDTNGLVGVRRFLEKVWGLQEKVVVADSPNFQSPISNFQSTLHQTIKKVSDDIEAMRFNTAIAKLMELVNEMNREEKISNVQYSILIQLLSPFAPHLGEELWEKFGDGKPLAFSAWPKFDSALAKAETITVAVQINGKVRDELTVPAEISEEEIKKLALATEKVVKWLEGKTPKKVIYVKGRLVSIVV